MDKRTDEQDAPTLSYAPAAPRSMRKKIVLAAGVVGVAGIAIVAAGMIHHARRARVVPLMGTPVPTGIQWQTGAPAGTTPDSATQQQESNP